MSKHFQNVKNFVSPSCVHVFTVTNRTYDLNKYCKQVNFIISLKPNQWNYFAVIIPFSPYRFYHSLSWIAHWKSLLKTTPTHTLRIIKSHTNFPKLDLIIDAECTGRLTGRQDYQFLENIYATLGYFGSSPPIVYILVGDILRFMPSSKLFESHFWLIVHLDSRWRSASAPGTYCCISYLIYLSPEVYD